MDPVSLIVSTVALAAPIVGKKLCEQGVVDAYEGFKGLIRKRFGGDGEVSQALAKVEANPESAARQAVLSEELSREDLSRETEILAAAQSLLEQLQKQTGGVQNIQSVVGNQNVQADRGSTVNYNQPPRS